MKSHEEVADRLAKRDARLKELKRVEAAFEAWQDEENRQFGEEFKINFLMDAKVDPHAKAAFEKAFAGKGFEAIINAAPGDDPKTHVLSVTLRKEKFVPKPSTSTK